MNIVGLNFGHDAGVSLVVDGVFTRHWEKERHVRVKHAMGLTAEDVDAALAYLEIQPSDVDLVAVASTQGVPIMLFGGLDVRPKFGGWPLDRNPNVWARDPGFHAKTQKPGSVYGSTLAWSTRPPRAELLVEEDLLGMRHDSMSALTLADMRRFTPTVRHLARRQCAGLEVEIRGRTLPGAFVSHHLCHAHYSAAEAQVERALVVTLDGANRDSFRGGGIYFAEDGAIHPVTPHNFWCGVFYDVAAQALKLGGRMGAAGKLMGLSAWGKPAYFDRRLIGNWHDLPELYKPETGASGTFEVWLAEQGLDLSRLPDFRAAQVPPVQAADVAASVQAIFEQNVLQIADTARAIARNAAFEYDALVLGGGCALNCPANSLLWRRFGKPVIVPPAVNDEGIAPGAALALHSLTQPRSRPARRGPAQIAYKGNAYAAAANEVRAFSDRLDTIAAPDPARFLGEAIKGGAIAGIFEGRPEIGPRALGHRSLLGSPLIAENWARLNRIKGRELWRPFAPIVLEDEAQGYFDGHPPGAYYMLFNARVTTRALPAVTHVDGTARVQLATPENGFVYALLRAFKEIAGHAALINTSFNGPNEPIVETPRDALEAMCRMKFDLLYLDGTLLRLKA